MGLSTIRITGWAVLLLLAQACGTEHAGEPDIKGIDLHVSSERLEERLFKASSEAEVLHILNGHQLIERGYFPDMYEESGVIARQLFNTLRNEDLRRFGRQLDSAFADFPRTVLQPLEDAFKRIRYYYPDFQPPKIVTVVSGFMGSDLLVTDSLVVIGLDYFGGPHALYRPQVHDYQLKRYNKENIVPAVLFFLSERYNKSDPSDKTLLADMIWFGKGFEFVKQVAPEVPDSLILTFPERDLVRTYNSQTDIWGFFTENKLLYESNEQKKQKYVGERPATPEIGEGVPGGIGRWLGWRIVSRYMAENRKATLPELMAMVSAQQVLQGAAYKGQVDDD